MIAAGAQVTGYLGKRSSPNDGDRDVYVVKWPRGAGASSRSPSPAPPNIDINLTISDAQRRTPVDRRRGRRRRGRGPAPARDRRAGHDHGRRRRWRKDQQFPVENVSDPYTLTVTEETRGRRDRAQQHRRRREPARCSRDELRGYLDTRDDVDLLRWTGDDGTYSVIVRADGLPLAWRIGDGKPRTPGAATSSCTAATLIRLERTDRTDKGPLPAATCCGRSWSR